ncbi:MAG: hypothetical protein LUH00_03035 [Lachnospiraceae bacterium]|nr:hypothetical protein [Lachnospiraceae bacterium]
MVIEFELYRELINASSGEVTATYTDELKAILEQKEDGKYQIVRVISGDSDMYMYTGDETESESTAEIQIIEDDSYLASLKGNLTKEELEFVLSQLRTGTSDFYDETSSYSQTTGRSYVFSLCWEENTPLESMGKDGDNMYGFYADEVNRLLSVFTDYQITEENDEDYDYSELQHHKEYDLDGDVLWLLHHVFQTTSEASINAVCEADDMLVVAYTYHRVKYSSQTEGMILEDLTQTRIALLEKDSDGLYRIVYNAPDYTASIKYPELKDVIEALAEIQADTAEFESETAGTEAETESESVSAVQTVEDDEYPDLLEGALTKAELEFVLTYGPEEMTEDGLTEQELYYILVIFCSAYNDPAFPLTYLGHNSEYASMFLADGFDRLFSVFTDFRVTEDNNRNAAHGVTVDGNTLLLYPATLSYDSGVTITEALYSEDKMILYYDYHREYMPEAEAEDFTVSKAAVLEKNANGNFQIVLITDAASVSTDELYAASETEAGSDEIVMVIGEDTGSTADTSMTDEIRALYEQVLQDVADGKYSFPDAEEAALSSYHNFDYVLEGDQYYYFVTDLDADDVPELVAALMYKIEPYGARVVLYYDCLIFDVESGELKQLDGDASVMTAYLASDGNGFLGLTEYYGGTGQAYISRVSIQSGQVVNESETTYSQILSSALSDIYDELTWTEISDLTGLDNVQ